MGDSLYSIFGVLQTPGIVAGSKRSGGSTPSTKVCSVKTEELMET